MLKTGGGYQFILLCKNFATPLKAWLTADLRPYLTPIRPYLCLISHFDRF